MTLPAIAIIDSCIYRFPGPGFHVYVRANEGVGIRVHQHGGQLALWCLMCGHSWTAQDGPASVTEILKDARTIAGEHVCS
jgi:hypothetical protein